ncbi:MAG: carboxypeptidase regulatory-like domain-containing protein, partial [Deltaproteobacteria bacterium]|nr:carboxypeptidase regulatory-like domain-containing protein [Deltaproteobacteria bacterium]
GNPRLVIQTGRIDFGYSGNMGGPPSQLDKLWLKGSQPDFVFNTTKKVGAGWLGPYPILPVTEFLDSLKEDEFGRAFEYTTTEYVRASDGQTVSVRIRSLGPDGAAGTSDDTQLEILKGEIFSTVTGKVVDQGGSAMKGATVTLNLPVNGTLGTQSTVTDTSGNYTFSNVSFGLRSLTVDPKLSYAVGSAKVTGGNSMSFKVTNFGTNNVSITSIKATYTTTPASFYEQVKVGGTMVFNWTDNNNTRLGSGATVGPFTAITVKGSGKPSRPVILRIDSDTVTASNLVIKGAGGSITIEYKNFKDAATGAAGNVTPNVQFTVEFSDGSVVVFTPV